jgi:tRNA:m4X modification enzyme
MISTNTVQRTIVLLPSFRLFVQSSNVTKINRMEERVPNHKPRKVKAVVIRPLNPDPSYCSFFVPKKNRYCRFEVFGGRRFCAEHSSSEVTVYSYLITLINYPLIGVDFIRLFNVVFVCGGKVSSQEGQGQPRERMPCPFDPSHTVFIDTLEKHKRVCNARPKDTPVPPYHEAHVNSLFLKHLGSEATIIKQAGIGDEAKPKPSLHSIPQDELLDLISRVKDLYARVVPEIALEVGP